MNALHVLLPMAGLGSRFSDAGFSLPKPLIPVDGMPMFLKALSSLEDWKVETHVTVVLRREHEARFGLATLIREQRPDCRTVIIEEMTRGAVETCLHAEEAMTGERGLLVMDCDLWFRSAPFGALVRSSLAGAQSFQGALLNFRSQLPRYSYALREGSRVIRTAEKKVISDCAIVGAYFFASERIFLGAAKTLMGRTLSADTKEFYLSLLYNILLEEGGAVQAADIEDYASFGTPEELAGYQRTRGASSGGSGG